MRADAAAGLLVGQVPTDELFAEVGETASVNEIEPMGTLHATPEYQRHLARVLTRRVLNQAFARANGA
jgi:CO/xanthine dehydrogenase FAD-binding subunit